MELQVTAERQKRAEVLDSETDRKVYLASGTEVTIVEVSNGILIVRPNS